MNELPDGFVIAPQAQSNSDLPAGFQVRPSRAAFAERFIGEPAPSAAKKPFGWRDTWPAKLAEGVYETAKSALTLPGDVYAGRVAPDSDEAIRRAVDVAAIASPASAGRFVTQEGLHGVKAAAPTSQQLRAAANEGYRSPAIKELEIKPSSVRDMGFGAENTLVRAGFDETVSPKTFGLLKRLQSAPEGSFVTGDNLLSLRKAFGHARNSLEGAEKEAARRVMEVLDDYVAKVPKSDVIAGDAAAAAKTMADARGNWAAAKRGDLLDRQAWLAELRSASANSGANLENSLRQKLKSMLSNERSMRGFSAEEKAAMENLVREGGGNILRRVGNILGGGGGAVGTATSGMIGAGVGSFIGGPVGGAIGAGTGPLAGGLLRSLSNRIAANQVGRISEAVRSRSPLGLSMQKFEEAAQKFQAERNAASVGTLRMTARNLSTNLKEMGVRVEADEVLKYLHSILNPVAVKPH